MAYQAQIQHNSKNGIDEDACEHRHRTEATAQKCAEKMARDLEKRFGGECTKIKAVSIEW